MRDTSSTRSARLTARTAALLLDSGMSTHAVLAAVERLNRLRGTRYSLLASWSRVIVLDMQEQPVEVRAIRPVTPHMGRATSMTKALEESSELDDDALEALIRRVEAQPSSPTWLFALAAGAGAVLLSLIFGAHHPQSIAVIFATAFLGGLARRLLAGRGATAVTQIFVAALLGGLAGAAAVHLGWTHAARLVAVCPAMVLVPGPQVINGAIEIAQRRHDLGVARLSDAMLTILAISGGVLLGLTAGGADLPVSATTRAIPWWLDMACGAAVAACYPVYFSMPLRTVGWSFLAGGLGHALHWVALSAWGWNAPAASLAACVVVSTLLTPVCRSRHLPFAGAGFAAVVSLVPGMYLFRAFAGMLDLVGGEQSTADTLLAAATDLSTAILIVLGMAVGLVVPLRVWHRIRP